MATRLVVKNFSCLKSADIELSGLTVLIGPSASGKSVLSKLVFFFNDLWLNQWQILEEGRAIDGFKDFVKEKFKEWFPVDAWGAGKFQIEFSAGAYQVRISRVEYKKKLGDNMRVWFSPFFEEQYGAAAEFYKKVAREPGHDFLSSNSIGKTFDFRDRMRDVTRKSLGKDFFDMQTFIPAGRSFFTSVGKSIVAFEQGRVLDPLILRFGRLYVGLKERLQFVGASKVPVDFARSLDELMSGALVVERSREYLKTSDGRKIPMSALSSGQQELMPLVVALKSRLRTVEAQQLIFIEEPEAHLFPVAQSSLVEIFARFMSLTKGRSSIFITTHSPYVLAKINNLIKAKEVAGSRRGKRAAVSEIISEECWISAGDVSAYGIRDGQVSRIQDPEDGLIEAEYLDEVSGSIAAEFSSLLGVEFSK